MIQQLLYAVQIFFAAICISFVSRNIRSLFGSKQSCFYFDIILGQVLFIFVLYVRSDLSRLLSFVLPYETYPWLLDFILLTAALVYLVCQKRTVLKEETIEWIKLYRFDVVLFFVGLLALCVYELPRTMMLSTDPDQHLYYAAQIQRFGEIPFYQRGYGNTPFGYPVGFAALVTVWSWFAGLSIPHALVVQPLLQALLTLGFVSESITFFKHPKTRLATTAFLILFFWICLPWVLAPQVFYFEATARVCAPAIFIVTLFLVWFRSELEVWGAGISIAVLALINPSLACIPLALLMVRHGVGLKRVALVGLIVAIGIASDSYYLSMIFPHYFIHSVGAEVQYVPHSEQVFTASYIIELFKSFFQTSTPLFAVLLVSLSGVVLWVQGNKKLLLLLLTLPIIVVASIACVHLLIPYMQNIKGVALLLPYILQQVDLLKVLYCYVLLAIVVSESVRSKQMRVVCFIGLGMYAFGQQTQSFNHLQATRQSYCPDNQCHTEDDMRVIEKMEAQYAEYSADRRPQDFSHVPKILIPNAPVMIGQEHWLLPTGASRILPLYDTFPLAFFYFQGSTDYSYESYQEHICKSFDLQWLMDRNIRYVFIPSYYHGCIRGLPTLWKNSQRIVFQSGKAALIDISMKHGRQEELGDSEVDN